jgi:FkbM family methyltransferase
MAHRDRYIDIKTYLKTETPVIIDGGANDGGTIERLLQDYRAPTIHAFEPIPHLVTHLENRYAGDSRVVIYGMALGAEAKMASFNVLNKLVASSFLTPSALKRNYQGDNVDIREVVTVPQVRLDDVMGMREIDLLKLDLQGYELEALKGGLSMLERTRIITTEVEFVPLYDNQPLFADVDVFIRAQGFRMLNLYELWSHPDGQLTSGDATYLNMRFF